MIRTRSALVVGALALGLLAVGGVLGTRPGHRPAAAVAEAPGQVDLLAASIARAQERLRQVPGDYDTWAALGTAYVERGRITADPTFYPLAEGALKKSLALRPADNPAALTGLGALANSRHDFAAARDWARKAVAAFPYHADAYAVLADAETQLGRPAAATAAVRRLLDLRPGLPAYTRAAYDLEQRGEVDEAEALLRRALSAALDPADVAFCRHQLGELAFHRGDLAGAEREYSAAADYLPAVHGLARLAAARGETARARDLYADLTRRAPTAAYLIEYANLQDPAGRAATLALAGASLRLLEAGGGADDLAAAELAIAERRYADAVRLAQREWGRRQFADVADLLGWALHLAGRDAEALPYARRAVATGARNAGYSYHLGLIELGLGAHAAAHRDLARAYAYNPAFGLGGTS